MKFRKHFDYDVRSASDDATIGDAGFSLTIQEHAIDCDINELMRRFKVTGQFPSSVRIPEFGDYTEVTDYRSALHVIMDAQDQFMNLDPKVRARFENDPQQFLLFAADPSNIDAMREMGLAVAKKDVSNGSSNKDVGSAASATGSGSKGDA